MVLYPLQSFSFWPGVESRWLSVEEIKFSEYYEAGEPIRNPAGATIVLAELILLNQDFDYTKDCLIYTVPANKNPGELKIINIRYWENCRDHLFSTKAIAKTKVYNLALELKGRDLLINEDLKKFKLTFFNMVLEKNHKIFETSASKTLVSGVQISFVDDAGDKLKNDELCYDVDDKCREILRNQCQRCPGGVYPVMASNCARKVRKYCGNKACGIKGNPACIRGYKATNYSGPYCINDSPLAYCIQPARVMCINGELICR